jgi:hypothetical protein
VPISARAAERSSARAMYRLDSEIIAISRRVSGRIGAGAMRPCSTVIDVLNYLNDELKVDRMEISPGR